MDRRIAAAKATLGRRLVILGHHYQRDEVIKFADYTGDSFKLARQVAKHPDAEFIVFCGVHFMAESADVLSAPHQQVILPDLAAGCSMADMAASDQLEMCWARAASRWASTRRRRPGHLHQLRRRDQSVLRRARRRRLHVVERGGDAALGVGARRADPVPARSASRPQHRLQDGRAARSRWWCGIRTRSGAASTPKHGRSARACILWKGHCSVHTRFTVRQIENIRAQHPGVRVIVHPEVPWDVVQAADDSGLDRIHHQDGDARARPDRSGRSAPRSTSSTASRARSRPTRTVLSLDQFGCLCSTMFRVSPNHLLWMLEGLVDGEVHNRIVVPDDQKHWTKVALDRMLSHLSRRPASHRPRVRRRLSSACSRKYDPLGTIVPMPTRRTFDGSHASAASVRTSTRSNRTSTSRRWRFITASITRPTSPT